MAPPTDTTPNRQREVLPHVPGAWVDESKTKLGYEIPLLRVFFAFADIRSPEEVKDELGRLQFEFESAVRRV